MSASSVSSGSISSMVCFSTKRVAGILLIFCRGSFLDVELAPVKSKSLRQFVCFFQDVRVFASQSKLSEELSRSLVLQLGQVNSKCNIVFSGARFFLHLLHWISFVKSELERILNKVVRRLIFLAKLRNIWFSGADIGSSFESPAESMSLSMCDLVSARFSSIALFLIALFQVFLGFLRRGLDMRSPQFFWCCKRFEIK